MCFFASFSNSLTLCPSLRMRDQVNDANLHLMSQLELQNSTLPTRGCFHVRTPALCGPNRTITDANKMDKTKDIKKPHPLGTKQKDF
jgi:hypothetical protein